MSHGSELAAGGRRACARLLGSAMVEWRGKRRGGWSSGVQDAPSPSGLSLKGRLVLVTSARPPHSLDRMCLGAKAANGRPSSGASASSKVDGQGAGAQQALQTVAKQGQGRG